MPSVWRVILPYVVINVVLLVVALVLVFSHHHTLGFAVLAVDAGNLMILRYKMFRWVKRDRS